MADAAFNTEKLKKSFAEFFPKLPDDQKTAFAKAFLALDRDITNSSINAIASGQAISAAPFLTPEFKADYDEFYSAAINRKIPDDKIADVVNSTTRTISESVPVTGTYMADLLANKRPAVALTVIDSGRFNVDSVSEDSSISYKSYLNKQMEEEVKNSPNDKEKILERYKPVFEHLEIASKSQDLLTEIGKGKDADVKKIEDYVTANGQYLGEANYTKESKAPLSPLVMAAWKGTPEVAEVLLKHGADVNQAVPGITPDGKLIRYTPISSAQTPEMARLLISKGAKVPADIIERAANPELKTVLKEQFDKQLAEADAKLAEAAKNKEKPKVPAAVAEGADEGKIATAKKATPVLRANVGVGDSGPQTEVLRGKLNEFGFKTAEKGTPFTKKEFDAVANKFPGAVSYSAGDSYPKLDSNTLTRGAAVLNKAKTVSNEATKIVDEALDIDLNDSAAVEKATSHVRSYKEKAMATNQEASAMINELEGTKGGFRDKTPDLLRKIDGNGILNRADGKVTAREVETYVAWKTPERRDEILGQLERAGFKPAASDSKKPISTEQTPQQLFSKVDGNGILNRSDGIVTRREIETFAKSPEQRDKIEADLKKAGFAVAESKSTKVSKSDLSSADSNRDGKVDRKELKDAPELAQKLKDAGVNAKDGVRYAEKPNAVDHKHQQQKLVAAKD